VRHRSAVPSLLRSGRLTFCADVNVGEAQSKAANVAHSRLEGIGNPLGEGGEVHFRQVQVDTRAPAPLPTRTASARSCSRLELANVLSLKLLRRAQFRRGSVGLALGLLLHERGKLGERFLAELLHGHNVGVGAAVQSSKRGKSGKEGNKGRCACLCVVE